MWSDFFTNVYGFPFGMTKLSWSPSSPQEARFSWNTIVQAKNKPVHNTAPAADLMTSKNKNRWEYNNNEELSIDLHFFMVVCSSKWGSIKAALKNQILLIAQRNGRNANPASRKNSRVRNCPTIAQRLRLWIRVYFGYRTVVIFLAQC